MNRRSRIMLAAVAVLLTGCDSGGVGYEFLSCSWDVGRLTRGSDSFDYWTMDPAESDVFYSLHFVEEPDPPPTDLFRLADEYAIDYGLHVAVYTPSESNPIKDLNIYAVSRENKSARVELIAQEYHDLLLSCDE